MLYDLFFLNSANLISGSISESPLDLEITKVNYISFFVLLMSTKIAGLVANRVEPDQLLGSVSSHLVPDTREYQENIFLTSPWKHMKT